MELKHHTLTITIYDREEAYNKVGELLHKFASNISLRVGYPIPEENLAIIFLVVQMSTDELGSLSGKLGQLPSVKVKSTTIKN